MPDSTPGPGTARGPGRVDVTYLPGPHLVLVRNGLVLLVEDAGADADALWTALDLDGAVGQVLDVLVGSGVTTAPRFALLASEGDRTRLLLRPGAHAVVRSVQGKDRPADADGLVGWLEEVVDADAVILTLDGYDPSVTGSGLPLVSGLARAGTVTWSRADVVRIVEPAPPVSQPAPPRPAPSPAPGPPPATPAAPPTRVAEADEPPANARAHDGRTVKRPLVGATPAEAPPPGRLLMARPCPVGHPNRPDAATCRECGAPLDPATPTVATSDVARAVVAWPDGSVLALRTGLLIGRSPVVPPAAGQDGPQGHTVPVDLTTVSRTHLELRLDGWDVHAVDHGSSHGSVVTHPDGTTERLLPLEPVRLRPGSQVTLGEEYTFAVR